MRRPARRGCIVRRTYPVKFTMTVLTIGSLFAVAVLSCVAGERVRRSPDGAYAGSSSGSGSFSFASGGSSGGGVYTGSGLGSRFGPPAPASPVFFNQPQQPFFGPDFSQQFLEYQNYMAQLAAQQTQFQQPQLPQRFDYPTNGDGAFSSISLGSAGDYGEIGMFDGNLVNRMSGNFGPPSPVNNQVSTFSSSSTKVSTDPNGKRIVQKETTIGGTKDGKVYFNRVSS